MALPPTTTLPKEKPVSNPPDLDGAGPLSSSPRVFVSHNAHSSLDAVARQRIQLWMRTHRLSRVRLGKAIGHSESWVSRYLAGKVPVTLAVLEKLATAFDRSLVELLTTEGRDPQEARLVEAYRAMPKRQQDVLVRMAEAVAFPAGRANRRGSRSIRR